MTARRGGNSMPWLKIHPWLIAETEERRRIRVIILRSRLYYKMGLILKQAIKPSNSGHHRLQKSSSNPMQKCYSPQTKSSFLKAKTYKGSEMTGVQIHVRFCWKRQRSSQFQRNSFKIKEVKRSLETLRKAAPSIFTDEMIDNIQEIIVKRRLNEKIRSSLTNDSSLSQQKSLPKVQVGRLKQEEPNVCTLSSQPRRTRLKRLSKNIPNVPESQKNYSAELEQIWKPDDQKILLNRYLQGQLFSQIKYQFQLKYPEVKNIFTTRTILYKFNRTIRTILHYIENLIKKFEDIQLPRLERLDNVRIKSIINDPFALSCRVKVLEVYTSDNITSTLVREAIEAINKYFHMKDDQE